MPDARPRRFPVLWQVNARTTVHRLGADATLDALDDSQLDQLVPAGVDQRPDVLDGAGHDVGARFLAGLKPRDKGRLGSPAAPLGIGGTSAVPTRATGWALVESRLAALGWSKGS